MHKMRRRKYLHKQKVFVSPKPNPNAVFLNTCTSEPHSEGMDYNNESIIIFMLRRGKNGDGRHIVSIRLSILWSALCVLCQRLQ